MIQQIRKMDNWIVRSSYSKGVLPTIPVICQSTVSHFPHFENEVDAVPSIYYGGGSWYHTDAIAFTEACCNKTCTVVFDIDSTKDIVDGHFRIIIHHPWMKTFSVGVIKNKITSISQKELCKHGQVFNFRNGTSHCNRRDWQHHSLSRVRRPQQLYRHCLVGAPRLGQNFAKRLSTQLAPCHTT